jgi:hypothetical protein
MNLIDWDHLMSLRDDIGEEDFADVVLVFFAEMDAKLADLAADPARADADAFHFLRGGRRTSASSRWPMHAPQRRLPAAPGWSPTSTP